MRPILWLTVLLAAAASGPDLTGRWTGAIEVQDPAGGDTINTPVRAEFEQKAKVVSGRIGRQRDERSEPIRNGRLEGNKLTFEVSSPESGGVMRFELTVTGELLEGTMKGTVDTGPISGKVRLTRQP